MSALPQDQNQQRTRAALTSKKFLLHHPSSISMDACVQRRGSSSERERWGLEGGGQALYQCATNGAPGQQSPAGLRGRSCQQLQHALQRWDAAAYLVLPMLPRAACGAAGNDQGGWPTWLPSKLRHV